MLYNSDNNRIIVKFYKYFAETEIKNNEKKTSFGQIVSTLLTIVICIVIGALVLNYAISSCH